MAASVGTLKASLALDTSRFAAGFAKARTIAGQLSHIGGIGLTTGRQVAGAFTAATAAMAGAAYTAYRVLSPAFESIDRNAKLADRLGISVEAVQKLSLAADLAGTDVEVLAKSMLLMGKNIGSGGKSLDARFFDVADAIANIKDPALRAKKAMDIFGKGGLELINVLAQGGRGIKDACQDSPNSYRDITEKLPVSV